MIRDLFLLMHGDDARLPVGSTKTAYTITDTYVKKTIDDGNAQTKQALELNRQI